ncbi:MAG: DNA-deoxyinosine glycosylase [Bacilli bacterium]|nr:DNA-deoxyinosine glycosylase [Bacilli bacterium]
MQIVVHPLAPIYHKDSRVLILGTMPSPKSREVGFYYGNPQNRFWSVMEDLFHIKLTNQEKKVSFLLDNKIALWDVVASCTMKGASDSTISDVIPNDIESLIKKTNITHIFTTGKKAAALYEKYVYPKTHIKSICLPSTSPANRAVKKEELIKQYAIIKNCLEKK